MRRIALRLGLITVSLVGSLLLAELVTRQLESAPPTGIEPIYRTSSIPGVEFTLVPSLDTMALGTDLRTNALGFRGPGWLKKKVTGTLRIALIGDSHAFGFGVAFDETMGEVLAKALRQRIGRPVEVLNFAVNSFNAMQELAVLRHIALGFAPDVVIIVPCNNDDEPANFVSASGYLVAHPDYEVRALPVRDILGRSAFLSLVRRVGAKIRSAEEAVPSHRLDQAGTVWMAPFEDGPVPEHIEATVGIPLRTMVRLSHQAGARVVLAPFAGPLEWRRLFRRIASEEGTDLVELLALFPEATSWDELLLEFGLGWNPHLGPAAHRRWGHALANVLAGEN